jgi:thiamine biosynthesis protein ThiI
MGFSVDNILLIHYSEIGTKGKNRSFFERRLRNDVQARLCPDDVTKVEIDNGRLIVPLTREVQKERVDRQLSQVFGIAWHAFGYTLERDEEALKKACLALAAENPSAQTFKVYCTRADKTYPLSSDDVCRRLGQTLVEKTGLRVNLTNHDLGFHVEILPGRACLYLERKTGLRGMPHGSAGRVLCLFSGGIDSPVAAWKLMRRGALVHFLHFHPFRQGSEVVGSKITELYGVLKTFNPLSRLYLIPHFPYQVEAALKVPTAYETVLFRRFILKVGQQLSHRFHMKALVTGDSLGQVASQTLENLVAAQSGLGIPLFQPIISYDKDDIVTLAKQIGTFDLSNRPYKDCCSLLSRRPKTNVTVDEALAIEGKLDVPTLINDSLRLLEVWDGKTLISQGP